MTAELMKEILFWELVILLPLAILGPFAYACFTTPCRSAGAAKPDDPPWRILSHRRDKPRPSG